MLFEDTALQQTLPAPPCVQFFNIDSYNVAFAHLHPVAKF